jgi:hypothetical protein
MLPKDRPPKAGDSTLTISKPTTFAKASDGGAQTPPKALAPIAAQKRTTRGMDVLASNACWPVGIMFPPRQAVLVVPVR